MKPKGATSAAGFLGLMFFAILTLLSSQATAQTIDHFKCYEANGDPVNVNVNLEDQFGVEPGVPVEEPKLFCNPVDTNGEGIGDPTAHLTGYEIGDDHAERIVIVSDEFGADQTLQIEDPRLLFVPSKKNAAPSDLNLYHFKCYEANGDPVNVNVNLEDQFGVEPGVPVEEPKLFCNPVDKNGEGIGDPTAHLTGYEIGDDHAEPIVIVSNQFGAGQILQIEDPEILFVPSKKNAVPSALNLDHFKCYKAQGVPVNMNVNLEDQFGVEPDVLVGIPAFFCTPVDKNGEGIMNPDADLTCYEIDADQGAEQVVVIDNQFGQQNLDVNDPELLCVPPHPATPPMRLTGKIVFVTSGEFNGNLGGLAGADAKCQAAADASALTPGTYTAWLSSTSSNARDRVTQSAAPYVRTDGALIADDFADLTNCGNPECLQQVIGLDENAVPLPRTIWTGTTPSGHASGGNCSNWTTSGGQPLITGDVGINFFLLGPEWTLTGGDSCHLFSHLYCFQD